MLTISDLRERLNGRGLNYTAIARAVGCSTKTLQRIRKGQQMPTLDLAGRIDAALRATGSQTDGTRRNRKLAPAALEAKPQACESQHLIGDRRILRDGPNRGRRSEDKREGH